MTVQFIVCKRLVRVRESMEHTYHSIEYKRGKRIHHIIHCIVHIHTFASSTRRLASACRRTALLPHMSFTLAAALSKKAE